MATPSATDRRSQRTRQLLRQALIDLMQTKSYAAISVKDILDRANVARSTFYTHFPTKDDLLFDGLQELLGHLTRLESQTNEPALLPSLGFLRHVCQQRRLYQALFGGPRGAAVTQSLQIQLRAHTEHRLIAGRLGLQPRVPVPVVADFVASAFLNLVRWWLDKNPDQSPEQVDAIFRQLVYPGALAGLGLAH